MRHKFQALYGMDLRSLLSREFGLPAFFVNDADAFAVGAWWGEHRETTRLVGVTLGTGIGSGFVAQGRLVGEAPGVPESAEVYDTPYKGGILEDAVSARAIERSFASGSDQSSEIDVAGIAARARAGDECASRVFAQFGRDLGEGLAPAISAFQPDTVALGGGISRAFDLFGRQAESAYERAAGTRVPFSPVKDPQRCSLVGVAAEVYTQGIGKPKT
jgi:glucokinase